MLQNFGSSWFLTIISALIRHVAACTRIYPLCQPYAKIHVCVCARVCVRVCGCMCLYIYIYTCMYVCMYVCLYMIYVYRCMFVYGQVVRHVSSSESFPDVGFSASGPWTTEPNSPGPKLGLMMVVQGSCLGASVGFSWYLCPWRSYLAWDVHVGGLSSDVVRLRVQDMKA